MREGGGRGRRGGSRRPRHVTPAGSIGRGRPSHPAGRVPPGPGPRPRRAAAAPPALPCPPGTPSRAPRRLPGGRIYLSAFPPLRRSAGTRRRWKRPRHEAPTAHGTPSCGRASAVSRCDTRGASRSVGAPSLLLTSAGALGPGGWGGRGSNADLAVMVSLFSPLPRPPALG